jgi:hypothetical protein
MEMKAKPSVFDDNNGVHTWREAEPEKVTNRASGRDARISKTVRMRLQFSELLRDESYRQSVSTGSKVSEADLLDQAMSEWKSRHGIKGD